eukprot:TRINITY_DN18519_c0_g1_i1.p1 TRINITY_DN18519_c0_g1~~TRINITY_DN18519_c0_g1_i1.p1  ORF type:complete len:446 (-),score=91.47 TRINITY_DN18519_c0_g1_i1:132-1469(-)
MAPVAASTASEVVRLKGHTWPADDPLLPYLLSRCEKPADGEGAARLRPLLSPILHQLPGTQRPEGAHAQNFMTSVPKVLWRAFIDVGSGRAVGAVVFTRDAAMRPFEADSGAAASVLDNLAGAYVIEAMEFQCVTRTQTTEFIEPLPLGEAVQWSCWVIAQDKRRVIVAAELRLFDADLSSEDAHVLVKAEIEFVMLSKKVGDDFKLLQPLVSRAISAAPPEFYDVVCHAAWPRVADQLASQLETDGMNPHDMLDECGLCAARGAANAADALRSFEFFAASKLRMRCFSSADKTTAAAIIHFTPHAGGPIGRSNGGAVLCAFQVASGQFLRDHLAGHALARRDLRQLAVHLRRAVPLGCIALLTTRIAAAQALPLQVRYHLTCELRVIGVDAAAAAASAEVGEHIAAWRSSDKNIAATGTAIWCAQSVGEHASARSDKHVARSHL